MNTGILNCKKTFAVMSILFMYASVVLGQTPQQKELINDARTAKAAFIEKDPGISQLFANAEGYVIFPNIGKGAAVVGGAAGNGVVYENNNLVGMAKLRQVDVGAQLGGQSYRQVIFFRTEEALQRFKSGRFELAANTSAVILEDGVARGIKFRDDVAVVTLPTAGAMVEISVGGQKFEFESFR